MICSLKVMGQEPVDSMNYSKYTEPDIIDVSDNATPPVQKPNISILTVDVNDNVSTAKVFPVDSMSIYSGHSPAKAAILSAVVPGLGQIYNRKYWKLPIVYVAVGVSIGVFVKWQNEYNRYRRAYIDIKDEDPYTNYFETLGFPAYYTPATKLQYITKRKDILRGWRDWSIVAVVAAYALNILDANVDAHLMDFNLDDNISLNIRPCFLENNFNSQKIGLSLQLTF
jgi:hypothetical protein